MKKAIVILGLASLALMDATTLTKLQKSYNRSCNRN